MVLPNNYKLSSQLLLGVVLTVYLLVRRLGVALPKSWFHLLNLSPILVVWVTLIFLLLLLRAIYTLLAKKETEVKWQNPLWLPFIKLGVYVTEASRLIWPYIWERLPQSWVYGLGTNMVSIMNWLVEKCDNLWKLRAFCWLLSIMPLWIVSVVFHLEILNCHKLSLYYIFMLLLLLPLLSKGLLSMLEHVADSTMSDITEGLKAFKVKVSGHTSFTFMDLKPSLSQGSYDRLQRLWVQCYFFLLYARALRDLDYALQKKIRPWIWLNYLLGWSTILIANLAHHWVNLPVLVQNLNF